MLPSSNADTNQLVKTGESSQSIGANANDKGFQMPSLAQFMELITDEDKSVVSSPSAYNVYNKYHKSS
jgi:hypothetical protein